MLGMYGHKADQESKPTSLSQGIMMEQETPKRGGGKRRKGNKKGEQKAQAHSATVQGIARMFGILTRVLE